MGDCEDLCETSERRKGAYYCENDAIREEVTVYQNYWEVIM